MMNEAIYGGKCHRLIWKNPAPFADQFEKHTRFGLILGDIGEIVEDQQMIFVELGDRRLEDEIAACDLELLHEVRGSGE
jgi:hypothetical protein